MNRCIMSEITARSPMVRTPINLVLGLIRLVLIGLVLGLDYFVVAQWQSIGHEAKTPSVAPCLLKPLAISKVSNGQIRSLIGPHPIVLRLD